MFQRISGFLRFLFQWLRTASFSYTEQAQPIWTQDMSVQRSISTSEKGLKETGPVAAMPPLTQERITEPYQAIRAIGRWQRPAERYRELDAMLAEIKRDRLHHSETMLLPVPVRRPTQQLYREFEPEEGNGR